MMMNRFTTTVSALALLLAAAPAALAEDTSNDQYVFDLGVGVMAKQIGRAHV